MRPHLPVPLVTLCLACAIAPATSAIAAAQHAANATPAPTVASLAGDWASAPDQLKLSSAFDVSVWGEGATSVRTVTLSMQRSGTGTLTVTRKIVDARGRTIPASSVVEEAQLTVGPPQDSVAGRREHTATVTGAVRRYPDDPNYRWNIDGLRVKVVTFDEGEAESIEVRYDTAEGRGSFWETLRRERRTPARRTAP